MLLTIFHNTDIIKLYKLHCSGNSYHTVMNMFESDPVFMHVLIVSLLICISLAVNGVFLMSLKADKRKLNNNEKIQAYKTCLLVLAMLVYIPFELWVIQTERIDPVICKIKDTMQSLFLDSYPIGTTALAIIRFRLAVCPDKLEILLKKTYFVATVIIFSTLPVSVAMSRIVVYNMIPNQTNSFNFTHQTVENNCYEINPTTINYFNISSSVLMYGIPSALMIILYSGIVYISSESYNRVQQYGCSTHRCRRVNMFGRTSIAPNNNVQSTLPRQQTRGNKILKSVITLVAFFLLVTIPVGSIEIYLNVKNSNRYINLTLLYLKTAICLFHAIGEGILFFEKRQKAKLFFDKIRTRSQQSTTITRRTKVHNTTKCNAVTPLNLDPVVPIQRVEVRRILSPIEEVSILTLSPGNSHSAKLFEENENSTTGNKSSDQGKYYSDGRVTNCRTKMHFESDAEFMNNRRFSNTCSPVAKYVISVTSTTTLSNHTFDYDISNSYKDETINAITDSLGHMKDNTRDQEESSRMSYQCSACRPSETEMYCISNRPSECKTCSISSFRRYSVHSNLSEKTMSLYDDFNRGTPISGLMFSPTETVFDFTQSSITLSSTPTNCWVSSNSLLSPRSPVLALFGTRSEELTQANDSRNRKLSYIERRISVISNTL